LLTGNSPQALAQNGAASDQCAPGADQL
jgi:hypothetical protein